MTRNKEKYVEIMAWVLVFTVLIFGYTDTIDTSLPAGSDDPAEADDNMRRIQGGFQEIINVEHDASLTGTEITGDGTHKDITATSVTSSGAISGTTIAASAAITVGTTLDVTGNIDPTTYEGTNGGFLDEDDMASDAADKVASQQSVKAYVDAYIKLVDSKATTVDAGTFTSGDWRKRTVTEETDVGGHVSVSSSVIVLDAGTYIVNIICPARAVNTHQARLRNTTANTTLLVGTAVDTSATNPDVGYSFIKGLITVATNQNLEIQHKCATTKTTDGLGRASDQGEAEIYTVAEFWKR